MNCEEISNVMPRYLAGESEEGEAVKVEEHLASCHPCAAALAADRQLDASLREAMLEDDLDASALVRRVVARMERVPWWRRAFAVRALRLATVSTFLLLVFIVGRGVYIQKQEKTIALAAVHDHYRDLVVLKRTDWAYSGESSVGFVESNFPHNPELVHLITPAGGTFEKVRLCNLNGTRYAHFVFTTSAGEVSVFLRARVPGEHTYTPEDVHDRTNGLEVAGFRSQSFVGAVVGQDGQVPTGVIAAQTARVL
jgi:hypothetical protein